MFILAFAIHFFLIGSFMESSLDKYFHLV